MKETRESRCLRTHPTLPIETNDLWGLFSLLSLIRCCYHLIDVFICERRVSSPSHSVFKSLGLNDSEFSVNKSQKNDEMRWDEICCGQNRSDQIKRYRYLESVGELRIPVRIEGDGVVRSANTSSISATFLSDLFVKIAGRDYLTQNLLIRFSKSNDMWGVIWNDEYEQAKER